MKQTQKVEGGSQTITTLEGLRTGITYNITVRAYQQLLGPASSPISVQTLQDCASGESLDFYNNCNIICLYRYLSGTQRRLLF